MLELDLLGKGEPSQHRQEGQQAGGGAMQDDSEFLCRK